MISLLATTPRARWLLATRLSYRAENVLTFAALVIGAVFAVLAGAAPTGNPVVDSVLTVVAVALAVLAAGAIPWWQLAVIAWVGSLIAFDIRVATAGLVAGLLALLAGHRHRDETALASLSMALSINVLFRSEIGGFGFSALIGVGLLLVLAASRVWQLDSTLRRRTAMASAAVAIVTIGIVGYIGLAGRAANNEMSTGITFVHDATQALRDGDLEAAAIQLDRAAAEFDAAHDRLAQPLMRIGHGVPVVAQHLSAGSELSAAAADVSHRANEALRMASSNDIRFAEGRIDVAALEALVAPIGELRDALGDLRTVSETVESPWLAPSVHARLASVQVDIDANLPGLSRAADALALLPDLLGQDGQRRYMLLFTTPAEARAAAGFIGNYAEIIVDRGQVTIGEFRRRSELESALQTSSATCVGCAEELTAQYGRFGYVDSDGTVAPRVWSNLTMAANFPDVAQAAAVLYPQSGGRQIDGVIALDPYVVQALMQFTGPVDLPELGVTVQPDDALQFIVHDQYLLAGDEGQEERIDGLAQLGGVVIQRLLTGDLPDPLELARTLAPFGGDRNLMVWMADTATQDLLSTTDLAGALPERSAGGFAMSINNAGGNKIDVFLDRTIALDVIESADGSQQLVADVVLSNNAPTNGQPHYVIGNEVGIETGVNRMLVTFYGPDDLLEATLDGEVIRLERGDEAGWATHRQFIDVPAGSTATFHLVFEIASPGPALVMPMVAWEQPFATV